MKRKRASASSAPFDFIGMSCPCCYRPGGASSLFCGERACRPDDARKKLAGLRALMRECGVAAYVVPSEDAHASEYVAAADERRAWLTGFTGSAGIALVTEAHDEQCAAQTTRPLALALATPPLATPPLAPA